MRKPQEKVDDDSDEQCNAQDGRPEAIIIGSTTTATDGRGSPVVGIQSVDHHGHGNGRKHGSTNPSNLVPKVEQTDSKSTEDNSEV